MEARVQHKTDCCSNPHCGHDGLGVLAVETEIDGPLGWTVAVCQVD